VPCVADSRRIGGGSTRRRCEARRPFSSVGTVTQAGIAAFRFFEPCAQS